MDEISAKPLTFLKFHQCRLLLSAGELATNTHLSMSVHYSRSALQGDGADDGEVPVSDAGAGEAEGWLHPWNFRLPQLSSNTAGFESAICRSGTAKFKPFGSRQGLGDPSPSPVCLPTGR